MFKSTQAALGVVFVVCAGSMLFLSCTTAPRPTAAAKKQKRPPAQNVHTYAGGNLVRDMQRRGGVGIDSSHSVGDLRP